MDITQKTQTETAGQETISEGVAEPATLTTSTTTADYGVQWDELLTLEYCAA